MGSYSLNLARLKCHFCHYQHLLAFYENYATSLYVIFFLMSTIIRSVQSNESVFLIFFHIGVFPAVSGFISDQRISTKMVITDFFIYVENSNLTRALAVFFPHFVVIMTIFFHFYPHFLWKTFFSVSNTVWYSNYRYNEVVHTWKTSRKFGKK